MYGRSLLHNALWIAVPDKPYVLRFISSLHIISISEYAEDHYFTKLCPWSVLSVQFMWINRPLSFRFVLWYEIACKALTILLLNRNWQMKVDNLKLHMQHIIGIGSSMYRLRNRFWDEPYIFGQALRIPARQIVLYKPYPFQSVCSAPCLCCHLRSMKCFCRSVFGADTKNRI